MYIYIYSWTYYSANDLSNITSTQKVKTQDVSNCEHSPAKISPHIAFAVSTKKHRAELGIHRTKTQKKSHYQSPFNTWTYSEGISTYGKSGKIWENKTTHRIHRKWYIYLHLACTNLFYGKCREIYHRFHRWILWVIIPLTWSLGAFWGGHFPYFKSPPFEGILHEWSQWHLPKDHSP